MDDDVRRMYQEPIIPDAFHRIEQLDRFLHLARTRTYDKGSIIVSQGTKFEEFIYVQKGCLVVSMGTDDGDQKFLFHINEGSIGQAAFLGEYHEVQIQAAKNSMVSFFTVKQILEIIRQDEKTFLDLMQNIASKTYYFMSQARDLNFYRPSSRVLRLLYNLCMAEGKFMGDCYIIQSNMTQKTIGNITGTHHVTVCKLLNVLEKQHILKKTKDEIIVYDLNKLKNMINEIFEY